MKIRLEVVLNGPVFRLRGGKSDTGRLFCQAWHVSGTLYGSVLHIRPND
jgi:hypothetical protein